MLVGLAVLVFILGVGVLVGFFRFFRRFVVQLALVVVVEQRQQRVVAGRRIQINHQAMFVFRYRRQQKHLRFDLGFQIQHHPHRGRVELAGTGGFDIGIVVAHFTVQRFQRAVQLHAVDVHHQALRVFHGEMLEAQWLGGFQRDAGIGAGWPHPHGNNLPCACGVAHAGQAQQGGESGRADQSAAGVVKIDRHCFPRGVSAVTVS